GLKGLCGTTESRDLQDVRPHTDRGHLPRPHTSSLGGRGRPPLRKSSGADIRPPRRITSLDGRGRPSSITQISRMRAQVPHEGCQTKGWVRAEAGPEFLRLFVAYTGLLEGDGLPTAAFLHIDAGEQDLPVHILSSYGSLDGGLAGNHCGVAIDAHLHIGKLVGGELGFAGFECVYHFRLA